MISKTSPVTCEFSMLQSRLLRCVCCSRDISWYCVLSKCVETHLENGIVPNMPLKLTDNSEQFRQLSLYINPKMWQGMLSIDLCMMLWRWRNLLLTYIQWHALLLQVRVSTHVTTPDHCNSYTLSDPNDHAFRSDCSHSHEDRCLSCEVLKGALKQIGNAVSESPLTEDEQDDMQYAFRLAVQAIESWKAHQFRSLQQDKARSTESLDESSVLITQDWAMKSPQRHQETQADWFGKRGIL